MTYRHSNENNDCIEHLKGGKHYDQPFVIANRALGVVFHYVDENVV